jgi:O-antigen ligase
MTHSFPRFAPGSLYVWLPLLGCVVTAALVLALGPKPVAVAAIAVALAALLWPRPGWTIAGVALANLLAVARAPLAIPLADDLVLANAAGPARTLLLALFVAQALRGTLGSSVPLMAVLAPVAPLLLAIWLSLAAAPARPADWENAAPFSLLTVSAFLLAWPLTREVTGLRQIVFGLAFAYGVMAVLNVVLLPLSQQPALIGTAEGVVRFQGILENPNGIGLLAFAGVPLLVAAGLLLPQQGLARWVPFGTAALLALEVALSVSRAGLAGMAAASVVFLLAITRGRLTLWALLGASALGALALLALTGLVDQLVESLRLESIFDAGGRAELWSHLIEYIGDRPLLGYGYGSSPDVIASIGISFLAFQNFVGLEPGNILFDAAVQLGLLGLVSLLVAVLVPLARIVRAAAAPASTSHHVAIAALLAVILGGLVNAQGESGFLAPGGAGVPAFWISLAAASALGLRVGKRRNSSRARRPSTMNYAPRLPTQPPRSTAL